MNKEKLTTADESGPFGTEQIEGARRMNKRAGRLTQADLARLNADLEVQVRLEEAKAMRARRRLTAMREDDGFGDEPTISKVAGVAYFW